MSQTQSTSPNPNSGDEPDRPEEHHTATLQAAAALAKAATGEKAIHPAMIPGVSIEDTKAEFKTNKPVFIVSLLVVLAVLGWAIIAPDNIAVVGGEMRDWVVRNFGWFFTAIMVAIMLFMFAIALAPTGKIRLGADDSEPEFSTMSWISMLFAAGLGIALIFYGPLEPLSHFLTPPPNVAAEPQSQEAVIPAMTQSVLHQATLQWGVYALVGGSLAYAGFRRGRLPLISSLFEPFFPGANNSPLGRIIDIFALLVTLFGTATSLGIGALQVRTGMSIVTGKPLEGNGVVVAIISILTAIFIVSAMSGVQRGIRLLSNTNMFLVIVLAGFVLITGPTLFILDLLPVTVMQYFNRFADMMSMAPSQGPVEEEFVSAWTIMYWAWWISWSPFVGMFIAKISKGRTLRQYVIVVILVPASLTVAWFIVFGGTAIWQNQNGQKSEIIGAGENVMFDLLSHLPLTGITSIITLIAIIVFFNTAADSSTTVMGSMSQSGRPVPSIPVVITWGTTLGLISLFLLLSGGQDTLSGLQNIMVSTALPFTIILLFMMVAFAKDLINDPLMIRRRYAKEAIDRGVRRGIDKHGDDFIFGAQHAPESQGAGAYFSSDDPSWSDWYTKNASAEYQSEVAEAQEVDRREHEKIEVSEQKDGSQHNDVSRD